MSHAPFSRTVVGLALAGACQVALAGEFVLGPEAYVYAGGMPITVSGYSVPALADWNNDGLPDLIVGEGGNGYQGKVRVYLNTGSAGQPQFSSFAYVKSNGNDLVVPSSGCLGAAPRVVQWDGDGRKDLLIGRADGAVVLYLNIGTDEAPTFDGGRFVQVGPPGNKADINVGARAMPYVVDWNNDGRKDLVIGALDGRVRLYLNEGSEYEPDFRATIVVQGAAGDLLVPSGRSAPVVLDLTWDGKKDLLVGNTEGQILLYANIGSDAAPVFAGYSEVAAYGTAINLPGTPRSRPFICCWDGGDRPDLLLGSADGQVGLYMGRYPFGDLNCDGLIHFGDINPFVLALTDPIEYGNMYPGCDITNGDMNFDGRVDYHDINPFVARLSGQ